MTHLIPALLVLLLACPGVVFAGATPSDVVGVGSGPVRGVMDEDGVRAFLGIPYAAPPVGKLRWQPPREVAPWAETRTGDAFGPACPQPRQRADGQYSEDCLFVNVWTPARPSETKLPVMVWIHGGAFNFGSASQPEYHGKNLSMKGVVVVTLNYRLGPLGFFAHPLLDGESERHTSGNYGLLDQIAALQWVQKNIAAFGGDPGNVTIFGQSAGSRSVSLLMLSPLAKGLFHRAIAQSGGPILGFELLNPVFNGDKAAVSKMGQELATKLGCDTTDDVLAALRATSAQDIVKTADCTTSVFTEGLFFAPVFDGQVLPENPVTAYATGRNHDVPMIVGSTLNEGTLYLVGENDLTVEKYEKFLQVRFGDAAKRAFALFPADTDAAVPKAIDHFLTVGGNAQPARFVAGSIARNGGKAYLYRFSRCPGTAMARQLGAHHGVDLAYVFGNMTDADGYTDTDRELTKVVMAYWVNFAKTGDPNGAGLLAWPAYDRASDRNMEFADTVSVNRHLYQTACDFIEQTSRYGHE